MEAATLAALPYREIWAVDYEFSQPPGERPDPACLVALELRSGKKIRLWKDQFGRLPPYPIGADGLFVAYYASAELNCHKALGWPMPDNILDLFTEFRNRTNGPKPLAGNGLIGALTFFSLGHMGATEKEEMRERFITGGFNTWSDDERREGLDYCEGDVSALARLLPVMLPFDLPRALLRGRYMAAVAAMEFNGVPIDVPTFHLVMKHWNDIQDRLIAEIDRDYSVTMVAPSNKTVSKPSLSRPVSHGKGLKPAD
jgi:DNA polymerase-1